MKLFCLFSVFGIFFFVSEAVSCQTPPLSQSKICKKPTIRGKYKLLSSGQGVELQIYLKISPPNRTDENYINIAKEFRQKYCQSLKMRIIYFGTKEQWQNLNPLDPNSTPLAIYAFRPDLNQVRLEVYTVKDGKAQIRKVDLSAHEELMK
jgi:hypothetical protein